ncbi:hypothetical protein ACEPAG_3823 [Sanghuangporus baumii]
MSETTGFIDLVYNDETFRTFPRARRRTQAQQPPSSPPTRRACHAKSVFRSSHRTLTEKPSDFWTSNCSWTSLAMLSPTSIFANDFDLYGHSWGGMLAAEYAATRQPRGLRRLIIAGSPASMDLWENSINKLLYRFSKDLVEVIRRNERDGTTESKEYQDAIQVFYNKHICRLDPWPKEVLEAFAIMEEDVTVYRAMFGNSELNITGSLRNWTVIDKLGSITVETLIMNGVDDEAQDECMQPFFDKIPKVKWVRFEKSSHMPFYEERERYFEVLGSFLRRN